MSSDDLSALAADIENDVLVYAAGIAGFNDLSQKLVLASGQTAPLEQLHRELSELGYWQLWRDTEEATRGQLGLPLSEEELEELERTRNCKFLQRVAKDMGVTEIFALMQTSVESS